MSDQEINITIAEACGWRRGIPMLDMAGNPFPGSDVPPNFCNDLNAMHEAENWLLKIIHEQGDDFLFLDHLILVCKNNNPVHATARQRAEAFLRTLGKWKEGAK